MTEKIFFSHNVGCLFAPILVFTVVQKFLSFMWSHFLTFGLNACATMVLVTKSFPASISSVLSPPFSIRVSSYFDALDPSRVELCVQPLPPKARESFWNREQKDGKSQK